MSQQDLRDYRKVLQLRVRPERLRMARLAARISRDSQTRTAQNLSSPATETTSMSDLPVVESPTEA